MKGLLIGLEQLKYKYGCQRKPLTKTNKYDMSSKPETSKNTNLNILSNALNTND